MGRFPEFSLAQRALNPLRRLIIDRRGVGAVEFAIVTPLLIAAYIGAFELSLGFTVARKTARASSAVSDIVSSQAQGVDKAFLDDMKNVAKNILVPYDSSNYDLKITGIEVTGTTQGKVVWSRGWSDESESATVPYAVNSVTTVPADLDAVNAFVVRTELVVNHQLTLFGSDAGGTIPLTKTSYYRQRFGDTIKCTDC
ncbi:MULTISPECIES: pilus assembly protein [unclassified Sinorhizobium]|uniref:TadE/TadG family type IV pilus assembly protein n=1 Tax=unclassified Sinorhizobium TaxID=2613772 RepID=UPI0024C27328|nr:MULTISPECIES: pilus assembly protein [unclassified Sinorhizobium]MDK1377430.1 pilus assembly protein [Sinorhizobium sp. 6-70]MDK1477671.1 pilus assembly protein [Sinorhizobium sp. 6-117]